MRLAELVIWSSERNPRGLLFRHDLTLTKSEFRPFRYLVGITRFGARYIRYSADITTRSLPLFSLSRAPHNEINEPEISLFRYMAAV